jgi:tyrosyl-tRNA synthetase
MQQFVELGHRVTLLIGDYTARIGDPSGRADSRPPMSGEQIDANMKTYREQAGRVLDLERTDLMFNSTWLAPLTTVDWIRLLSKSTVAQILEREDFKNRYASRTAISLHELLYPVAQAYDSVAMQADVELGGDDQLFNFLLARDYQADAGQTSQVCMTMPILEGTDGIRRMGKSLNNFISLIEPPEEQFGKIMRLPDELIPRYARLAAFWPSQQVDELQADIGADRVAPIDAKKRVAEAIVAKYHGADAGRIARERFEQTVQRRELPTEMPTLQADGARKLVDLIVKAGFAESKRAAERLIAQGGVRIDGNAVGDAATAIDSKENFVLSVGARRFVRIVF